MAVTVVGDIIMDSHEDCFDSNCRKNKSSPSKVVLKQIIFSRNNSQVTARDDSDDSDWEDGSQCDDSSDDGDVWEMAGPPDEQEAVQISDAEVQDIQDDHCAGDVTPPQRRTQRRTFAIPTRFPRHPCQRGSIFAAGVAAVGQCSNLACRNLEIRQVLQLSCMH